MTDPYDHMREAFHIVADGLMEWKEPPERAVSRSNGLGASYLPSDIDALETAGELLTRDGHVQAAIALWSIALRIRQAL
jgi:hypothetical protein